MPTGKFINYGEIDKEEEEEETSPNGFELPAQAPTVNINEIKENATNINSGDGNEADLDNMLNLNLNNMTSNGDFITPAEKIVKTDPEENTKEPSDYFQTPDLSSVGVTTPQQQPPSSIFDLNNSQPAPSGNSVEDATNKIRNLVEEIKNSGIKIDIDEMNFDKSYQVIIKIDKEQ